MVTACFVGTHIGTCFAESEVFADVSSLTEYEAGRRSSM